MGPRTDASLPSAEERKVLLKIAKPAARSVAITRTHEVRAGEHRRTLAQLHRTVDEFQARLDRLDPRGSTPAAR